MTRQNRETFATQVDGPARGGAVPAADRLLRRYDRGGGGALGRRRSGAAALWESLPPNHPFVDGNKRAAFAATYTFLAINGGRFTVEAAQAMDFIVGVYESHTFEFSRLAAWLRTVARLPSDA